MTSQASTLSVGTEEYRIFPLSAVEGASRLPLALKVMVENVLRNVKDDEKAKQLVGRIVDAGLKGVVGDEIEFAPARVLFQDFTGVPVFVDFAVMREASKALGGDPANINPQVPCNLVIDHSVIADEYGCADALSRNMSLEFERNGERYAFLKWAQSSFENVSIVPPGAGICHQLNIERFASVVMTKKTEEGTQAYFDTLVGTDSHTPTANGIGVLGWGVGGIEAEAAALGQPITTLVPRVVGVKLTGSLPAECSAMDVSLTFAEMLRAEGVVGCFVEVFGEGVSSLSATQRACVSNMTPEYGSTCTLFPVDEKTLEYLRLTGRSEQQIALVEAYSKEQGFWNDPDQEHVYSKVLTLDLSTVKRSIAGPSRPHDRIEVSDAKAAFERICAERKLSNDKATVELLGNEFELTHGAIAIAAVTSCTTATDASMMISAGLLARNADKLGLSPKPWVKTILAPGSKATEMILDEAGLMPSLRNLGFYTCGFGCMSCIGNSGPVLPEMHEIANDIELASVLSGNRNFEGRISPDVSQNYLCQPALVVAYSLVGTMDFDFETQPLGTNTNGQEIFLSDIWPDAGEVKALLDSCCTKATFEESGKGLFEGGARWKNLEVKEGDVFEWDEASTYVRRAPYFDGMGKVPGDPEPVQGARVLLNLGDFITTDHISPAGSIAPDSPAARYLEERGVSVADFNTYGSRRGNHEVMMRGTFANVKLQNKLAAGRRGGWTLDQLDGEVKPVWDAAEHYLTEGIPSVIIAGKMYGSGSSRDWAGKGPMLQGVKAVFAESFERIHRSNLIGMGVLPLQFLDGQNALSLGLDGSEVIDVDAIDFSHGLPEPSCVRAHAVKSDGSCVDFDAVVRIDTPTEGEYYRNGGILQYVLRSLS